MKIHHQSKMPMTDEELDEVCETFQETSLNGRCFDDSSLSGEPEEFVCAICNEPYDSPPRILSCLHVFCENCVDKLISDSSELSDGRKSIRCNICEQVTNVKTREAASLPCDYVLMNLFEMGAINSSSLLCTSCKAQEKAVARCADCPHFLCPNCNSAHQYMRCFENHYVVSLDEIKESEEKIPIHKPIYCNTHKKVIQFFCSTCEEAICLDCTNTDHKPPVHMYDKISAACPKERAKLDAIVTDVKQKWDDCMKTTSDLENSLSDLQMQHDNAKDLINETFQSYKAILEKCREEALEDLSKVHVRQELKVMDAMQNMEKKMDKIAHACSFANRILENGSDGEVLMLKSVISKQLETLSENIDSKSQYVTGVEFITDMDEFQNAAKKLFGYVKNPDAISPPEKVEKSEKLTNGVNGHDSLQDLLLETNPNGFIAGNPLGISVMNGSGTTNTVSMQSSPVTSSPLSMPSSFDGDINFQAVTPQTPPLEGLTTLGEMNLTRLASLACTGGKPPSPPISNPSNVSSGFPLDLLVPSEIPSTLINNIQALAKLGSVNMPEPVNEIMPNGYGNMNGMGSSNMMSSAFDSNVDHATSVLDLVNGSSSLMMNGHGPSFDPGHSNFFSSHNGMDSNGIGHNGASNGLNHHNGFHPTYSRSNSQRVAPLEIHFKFGQLGNTPSQFGSPHGFCIGEEDAIVVADTNNHRIQIFSKDGEYRTQFGVAGKLEGQLWYPRKVEILPTGNFVICDRGNERSRLQLFSREGLFIKKIRLRYVDIVAGMTVTDDGEIVIVDSVQPSLYKLDEHGSLSTWFDCKGVMTEPSDIAVRDQKFYICDFKGHCVVVFSSEGQFLNRIGNQGLTDYPNGIDVLPNGNILVGDSHGNKFHICIFLPDGTLLCEYECPYVKVSRCCGLKITSEGCIITVAKNNHHVLVLKSPF